MEAWSCLPRCRRTHLSIDHVVGAGELVHRRGVVDVPERRAGILVLLRRGGLHGLVGTVHTWFAEERNKVSRSVAQAPFPPHPSTRSRTSLP